MNESTVAGELSRIRALMEESQRFLCGTWRHQLLWGGVTSVGLLATWWGLGTGVEWVFLAWPVMLVLGWAGSLVLGRAEAGSAQVSNVATRAFGGIWLGLGVTLTLLGTVGIYSGAIEPQAVPGVLSVVFGTGYFASGFLAGIRWLSAVGVGWWAGGVGLFFLRTPEALLVMVGMVLALEVVPALVLRGREHAGPPTG